MAEYSDNFYNTFARDALKGLSLFGTAGNPLREEMFVSSSLPEARIRFLVDADIPSTYEVESYIKKFADFVSVFLIASRLAEVPVPPSIEIEKYVDLLIRIVGGSGDGEVPRKREDMHYNPSPALSAQLGTPFIDFCGSFAVTLIDYLTYAGKDNMSADVSGMAKREVLQILHFLTDPETFIEVDEKIGWAFVSGSDCDDGKGIPIPDQRHILPTAWAVTALARGWALCKELGEEAELRKKIKGEILPKALAWIDTLKTENGLYKISAVERDFDLVGHNFATETLITMSDMEIPGSVEESIEAVERFTQLLDEDYQGTYENFEANIGYRVYVKSKPVISYDDKTTWAHCLSTLALSFSALEKRSDATEELREKLRNHCVSMADQIINVRRNSESGLWDEKYLQIHWNLAAVEALLRLENFVSIERYEISDEHIRSAVARLMDSVEFQSSLEEHLIGALSRVRKVSK